MLYFDITKQCYILLCMLIGRGAVKYHNNQLINSSGLNYRLKDGRLKKLIKTKFTGKMKARLATSSHDAMNYTWFHFLFYFVKSFLHAFQLLLLPVTVQCPTSVFLLTCFQSSNQKSETCIHTTCVPLPVCQIVFVLPWLPCLYFIICLCDLCLFLDFDDP